MTVGQEQAQAYAGWFETPLGRRAWEDERRALRRLLTPAADRRVLDAGAGEGRLAVELAREGARVTALDLSVAMLGLTRKRARSAAVPLETVQGELTHLPFRSATFQQAIMVTVLCLVREPRPVLLELARVLEPGGSLVVGELGRWSPWNLGGRLRSWRSGSPWSEARFWSRRGLERLAREAGLTPEMWDTAVFYSPGTHDWRVARTLERILGGKTAVGAAFLAMRAVKPVPGSD